VVCSCGQEICGKCGNVFHGYFFTSCNKAIDEQFDDWARSRDVRFCPYCKARIEKAEGCNHMTCYYCEFQFCWICGATYTSDHFTALNPMGCGGMQFIGD
jgi:E3 ubiquitin-protein ligase RNF19A